MEQYGGSLKKPKKATKTKKTAKTSTKAKKASTTSSKKTTKTRSKAKGGNFLGAVGDLVAPTGWGPFATAAGLLALDRADAALRRGTKEKKEKMKGGKKMTGGDCKNLLPRDSLISTKGILSEYENYDILNKINSNLYKNRSLFIEQSLLNSPQINIICEDGIFNLELLGICNGNVIRYKNDQTAFMNSDFNELKKLISKRDNQLRFFRSCLKSPELRDKCIAPKKIN